MMLHLLMMVLRLESPTYSNFWIKIMILIPCIGLSLFEINFLQILYFSYFYSQFLFKKLTKKESIVNQQKNQQSDDKLMQTQALTLQRYSTYQKEFNLLQFALTSAQIFFRTEEIEEDKNE